jgi:hypothetical protein
MRHRQWLVGFVIWTAAAMSFACGTTSSGDVSNQEGGSAAQNSGDESSGGSSGFGGANSSASGGLSGLKASVTNLSEFQDAIAQAYCNRLFKCPAPNDKEMTARGIFGSVQGCLDIQRLGSQKRPDALDLQNLVSNGTVHLQLDRVPECLDSIASCRAASVDGPHLRWQTCRAVFRGDVGDGGSCRRHEQCGTDSYCKLADGGTSPGICQPLAGDGEACQDDDSCRWPQNGFAVCENKCRTTTYAPSVGEGQSCVSNGWGFAQVIPCSDGMWCNSTGTCSSAPIAAGAVCLDSDDVCDVGAKCLNGSDGTRTCQPVTNTLTGASDGIEGAPCTAGELASIQTCAAGLFCAETTNACQKLLEAGQACSSRRDCASGSCHTTCDQDYCGRTLLVTTYH